VFVYLEAATSTFPRGCCGEGLWTVHLYMLKSLRSTCGMQVNADGVFRYASSRWFLQSLQTLAATGIRGVAIDVWVSGLSMAGRASHIALECQVVPQCSCPSAAYFRAEQKRLVCSGNSM
jgi:hypothetical protein